MLTQHGDTLGQGHGDPFDNISTGIVDVYGDCFQVAGYPLNDQRTAQDGHVGWLDGNVADAIASSYHSLHDGSHRYFFVTESLLDGHPDLDLRWINVHPAHGLTFVIPR